MPPPYGLRLDGGGTFCNVQMPYQVLVYQTPVEVVASILMEAINGGMVESLTLDTLRTAGHDLNKAPILS